MAGGDRLATRHRALRALGSRRRRSVRALDGLRDRRVRPTCLPLRVGPTAADVAGFGSRACVTGGLSSSSIVWVCARVRGRRPRSGPSPRRCGGGSWRESEGPTHRRFPEGHRSRCGVSKTLAGDPANFGVLIEAGEALALGARPGPARARPRARPPARPSHPGAWHWLGHAAYLEKNIERADAQWQVSNVLRGGNGDVLYDLACSSSIMGRIAESDAFLRKAWAAGFRT